MDKIVICCDHDIGYRIAEYLLDAQLSPDKSFQVMAIFGNQPPAESWWKPVSGLAQKAEVPYFDYSHNTFRDFISKHHCDYVLLLSWKHFMPADIVQTLQGKMINLHYSLLPSHRGVYPVNFTIASGDELAGISYHYVSTGLDSGDIIVQDHMTVDIIDDARSLLVKLDQLAYQIFIRIWDRRHEWNNWRRVQGPDGEYHSRKDFVASAQFTLSQVKTAEEWIRFLRSRSFGAEKSSAYFIEEKTGRKIHVAIHLYEDKS